MKEQRTRTRVKISKRQIGKIISLVLSLALVFSMASVSAMAADSGASTFNYNEFYSGAVADCLNVSMMPFFKGGTIYWECPWPTDGRGFKAYCHIWGSDGSALYDWQDPKEEMTPATDKGDNIFKYDVPAGPYDEVIFSVSTGVQTFDCVLTDDCIGKTATTDKSNMIENPMDSNKTAAATEFDGVASSGPHLGITSLGNVIGKVKCPTEDGASIVAMFIKNYLVVNPDIVTSDTLANLVKSFDTTAQDVYNALASDSEFPSFTLDDGTKQLDKAAELLGITTSGGGHSKPVVRPQGWPSFKGGTIYWECPWPTDGRGFKAYCHVWGSDGTGLYDWQDSKEEMTSAPEKGENVFKYDIPAGSYDLLIFSISTGVQTYDCVLTDDCIGKIAKTDTSNMIENPMDSNKTAASTEFEGVASSGPHLAITSLGKVVGKVMCPTEDGASIVAMFIKNYLNSVDVEITADMLANLISYFDTTPPYVYLVLSSDSEFPSFTLDDGTKQLDKAAELLGITTSGGGHSKPVVRPQGWPSFKGGTIYWECPWPTDGRGFKAYCHVWGSDGTGLYDWQDSKEEMTSAPEKGENVFKYDIPAGPYDEVIFSTSTGVQTYDCVLTDECIGKIAKTDKNNMIENTMDSNKTAAATEFEGVASSGPHLGITSLGKVVGKVKCPTEDGASIVAMFIKNYLNSVDIEITADTLSCLISSFETSAQDVYNILALDSEFPSFTLDDGTKQLDKAAELLGIGYDKGDVNGDGTIDAKDRMFITRHIAKWQGYESIIKTAADVNSDGLIDAKDRMVLTRHIAKWIGYEKLPYVKNIA